MERLEFKDTGKKVYEYVGNGKHREVPLYDIYFKGEKIAEDISISDIEDVFPVFCITRLDIYGNAYTPERRYLSYEEAKEKLLNFDPFIKGEKLLLRMELWTGEKSKEKKSYILSSYVEVAES